MFKLFSIFLLVFGEILTIYAEISGAKLVTTLDSSKILYWVAPSFLVVIGSVCLLTGYVAGIMAFHDIWLITAISVTAILVTEPFLCYLIFKTTPSWNALIGFLLGAVGLVITLWE